LEAKGTSGFVEAGPRVTIITVVINGGSCLGSTIRSVAEQTYSNTKYLVIDGGSTDGTLAIIRRYENHIDFWLSEKDSGIYDAMNKGALKAGPGYLCFMNAGDVFFSVNTVEKVIARIGNRRPAIIYGDSQVSYEDGFSRIIQCRGLDHLWKGMCFSHQSMFVDSELMKKYLYNVDNSIGADYEFICGLYSRRSCFMLVDEIVATTSAEGVSDTKRFSSINSHWRVARTLWPGLKTDIYYMVTLFDAVLWMLVRRILPRSLISGLRRLKYKNK